VGEDVTANLRTIAGLPVRLTGHPASLGELELRGEVFMARAACTWLNRALARGRAPATEAFLL
jgi:DNA ligase (NAD+)